MCLEGVIEKLLPSHLNIIPMTNPDNFRSRQIFEADKDMEDQTRE